MPIAMGAGLDAVEVGAARVREMADASGQIRRRSDSLANDRRPVGTDEEP